MQMVLDHNKSVEALESTIEQLKQENRQYKLDLVAMEEKVEKTEMEEFELNEKLRKQQDSLNEEVLNCKEEFRQLQEVYDAQVQELIEFEKDTKSKLQQK